MYGSQAAYDLAEPDDLDPSDRMSDEEFETDDYVDEAEAERLADEAEARWARARGL